MGYRKMSFGCLKVGMSDYNIPIVIPQNPTLDGDIFEFNSKYSLFFGTTEYPEGKITWIKPDNMPIFVADRVLLNKISYTHLVREGFATNGQIGGKVVHCNGVPFCCRLLDVGAERINGNPTAASEWDVCLHVTGDNNELWHWSRAGFWGTCATERKKTSGCRPFRGFNSSYFWGDMSEAHEGKDIGFRPVLEPLQSMALCQYKEITLDAQTFCVIQNKVMHPKLIDFRPALYPQVKLKDGNSRFTAEAFGGLSDGQEVRMYTLIMNGKPVRQDMPYHRLTKYKAGAQLALTDQYYGEEYLISWIIHHGCAFAAKDIIRDVPAAELIRQGFLPN